VSITNTATSVNYTANGVTLDFATTFRFLDEEHLVVEVDDEEQTLGSDYTVSGEDDDEGGTVSFLVAPAAASVVAISRETPVTQETSFRNNGQSTFSPVLHERALDKLTMIAQEERARTEALEALGATLATPVGGTLTIVNKDFTTNADSVEATFPLNVATAGPASGAWVVRLVNRDDAAELFDESPAIQWDPGIGNNITLRRVDGLKPNTNYTIYIAVASA
jgi:hypothetical protein